MERTMKKVAFSIVLLAAIPLYCLALPTVQGLMGKEYTWGFAMVMHCFLIGWCILQLQFQNLSKCDMLLGIPAGGVTVLITFPITVHGVIAGIVTMLIYWVCRDMDRQSGSRLTWVQRGFKRNFQIIGVITLIMLLFTIRPFLSGPAHFTLFNAVRALAPSVSEELLWRVLLLLVIRRHFGTEEDVWSTAWVILLTTVPFIMLHVIDLSVVASIEGLVGECLSMIAPALFIVWAGRKYGVVYGIYAHALMDFFSSSFGY